MIPVSTLVSWSDYPSANHPHVYPISLRFDPLIEKLWLNKVLVLCGPRHGGKRTLGLYAVKKWMERYDDVCQVFYFDGSKSGNIWDEEELRVDAFWERNTQPTPTLYVFARCVNIIDELN